MIEPTPIATGGYSVVRIGYWKSASDGALQKVCYPSRWVEFEIDNTNPTKVAMKQLKESWGSSRGMDDIRMRAVRTFNLVYQTNTNLCFYLFAKRLQREARVWIGLDHPHIVKLQGFMMEPSPDLPFSANLISMWYAHGNIITFLKNHANADRQRLVGLINFFLGG